MMIGILCEGEKTDQPVLQLLLRHRFPKGDYGNVDFVVKGVTKAVIFSTGDAELRGCLQNEC